MEQREQSSVEICKSSSSWHVWKLHFHLSGSLNINLEGMGSQCLKVKRPVSIAWGPSILQRDWLTAITQPDDPPLSTPALPMFLFEMSTRPPRLCTVCQACHSCLPLFTWSKQEPGMLPFLASPCLSSARLHCCKRALWDNDSQTQTELKISLCLFWPHKRLGLGCTYYIWG